ncbi:MAG: hypothetical protein JWO86_2778 [Myxococcaceae bacterium]|nr:hypothetical protein [Myxococcaceae bacterium]
MKSPCELRYAAAVIGALLAIGCGPVAAVETGSRREEAGAGRVAAFQQIEDDVLRGLAAADRRVAARARIEPREEDLRRLTMGALLAEDPSLAVIDGAIDPFSFEARERGLTAVKAKLATAPAELPAGAQGMMPAPAFEKELLVRVVDEELVRLEEERALPRSASALVRGVVETWQQPLTPQQAGERDRWLARRLGEVNATITKGGAGTGALDVVRARELDDALDGLEHAAEAGGLAHATAELVNLRVTLEALATRPAAAAASDWGYVGRRVQAHLGFALTAEALDTRLASLEKALRAAATSAIEAQHLDTDALQARAAPLVFRAGPCAVAVPGSRVRSMAPPPERIAACHLRQTVATASDDAGRANALVAMHDHVVVAQWALDVARGSATIAQTTGKHRPLSRPGPDVVARWERIALARPTAAIGGGLAADVLFAGGENDTSTRARAWSELGEVPLDIAGRELQLRPLDAHPLDANAGAAPKK